MYVCLCNPFTDKDVKRALCDVAVKNTTAQIYKACSGGKGPNCGNCLCTVKDFITDHHATLGVQKLVESLPDPVAVEPLAAD